MSTDSPGELKLFDPDSTESEEWPLIYVATPLTHLSTLERQVVSSWSEHVRQAALDIVRESGVPWRIRVHLPTQHSAPWKADGLTADDVYRLNSELLWSEVDALIVIGHRGGSIGAGQEFAWACTQAIPILFLHSKDSPPSRQVIGTRRHADLVIAAFDDPVEIHDLVHQFLRGRRIVIEDRPRRRRDRRLQVSGLRQDLRAAWEDLLPDERLEAIAISGFPGARIYRLLTDDDALACASLGEILAVSGALGVGIADSFAPTPYPELSEPQFHALEAAAQENEWDGATALGLLQFGRAELAKGGVRRLPLSNIEDWTRLFDVWRSG